MPPSSTTPSARTTTATEPQANRLVGKAFTTQAADYLVGQYLPKIERCLESLSDEQLWWRLNHETNCIGNLVLHLCGNARQWIVSGLGGTPDNRIREAEFSQTEPLPRGELLALLHSTVAQVEGVLTNLNPDTLLEKRLIQGVQVDVLEAVFHVTEHFSMHTGQIILLTKLLTGKDLGFYDFSTGVPAHRW